MGMALTSCTPPAKGSPLFELGDDEMEMGVGIHGEPGRQRKQLADANAIVDELLDAVVRTCRTSPATRSRSWSTASAARRSASSTSSTGARINCSPTRDRRPRNYVGEYCTSLDMAGASVTLVKLDDELDKLLEAPAEMPVRIF